MVIVVNVKQVLTVYRRSSIGDFTFVNMHVHCAYDFRRQQAYLGTPLDLMK